MFSALLDTNVLWPSLRRDVLLSFAAEGLYRPLWSDVVLAELEHEEAAKLWRRDEPQPQRRAARLVAQMRTAFEDALVDGWQQVRPFGLPDPDDEHVLAAAFVAGAGALVTENVRDFPRALVPATVEVVRPADFARDVVSVDPDRARAALAQVASRRGAQDPAALLTVLERRYAMHEAAALLREA